MHQKTAKIGRTDCWIMHQVYVLSCLSWYEISCAWLEMPLALQNSALQIPVTLRITSPKWETFMRLKDYLNSNHFKILEEQEVKSKWRIWRVWRLKVGNWRFTCSWIRYYRKLIFFPLQAHLIAMGEQICRRCPWLRVVCQVLVEEIKYIIDQMGEPLQCYPMHQSSIVLRLIHFRFRNKQ